jgi:hypothetical protein
MARLYNVSQPTVSRSEHFGQLSRARTYRARARA